MLTHADIWRGIDKLAERHGLSPSGLARKAGLDPTTFNPSKRASREGKRRWPSTESLAKILEATNTSLAEFVQLIEEAAPRASVGPQGRLRAIRFGEVQPARHFDASGFPTGEGWDEMAFPAIDDPQAWILELDRDLAPPCYREGDLLVISPNSTVRRGDRVLYCLHRRTLGVGLLLRRTINRTVLEAIGTSSERTFNNQELDWLARILWVSQ